MTDGSAYGRVPLLALDPSVSERLARALASAVRQHDPSMRELEGAVGDCTVDLRSRGMPAEVALVLMKELVRQTASRWPPPGTAASRSAADTFMEEIGRWCIAAFYRTGPAILPSAGTV